MGVDSQPVAAGRGSEGALSVSHESLPRVTDPWPEDCIRFLNILKEDTASVRAFGNRTHAKQHAIHERERNPDPIDARNACRGGTHSSSLRGSVGQATVLCKQD